MAPIRNYSAWRVAATSRRPRELAWRGRDDIFDPEGVGAWLAKLDADAGGGKSVDERFFPRGDAFRGLRVHQTRLQGGDASSDSYCFTG